MSILNKLKTKTEQLHAGEAYSVWDQATTRYDTFELTKYLIKLIHDKDLKLLVNTGINNVIEPQIKQLEDFATENNIALPSKPSKTVGIPDISKEGSRDETVFRIILDGAQSALLVHVKSINIATHDKLRNMYKEFLKNDLDNYEIMLKYGKNKGWIKNPPHYEQ